MTFARTLFPLSESISTFLMTSSSSHWRSTNLGLTPFISFSLSLSTSTTHALVHSSTSLPIRKAYASSHVIQSCVACETVLLGSGVTLSSLLTNALRAGDNVFEGSASATKEGLKNESVRKVAWKSRLFVSSRSRRGRKILVSSVGSCFRKPRRCSVEIVRLLGWKAV